MNRFLSISARASRLLALTGFGLALAACAGSTALVKYCCYDGEAALARLDDVSIAIAGGRELAFRDVYKDFTPDEGFFTKPLPIQRVVIASVIYQSLAPVLPLYDANGNGILEPPELTLMYVREGALGLGVEADHLVVNGKRANALTTSAADIGGLMRSIDASKDSFPPASQAIFSDMERLGLDYIQRGSEGPDPRTERWTP